MMETHPLGPTQAQMAIVLQTIYRARTALPELYPQEVARLRKALEDVAEQFNLTQAILQASGITKTAERLAESLTKPLTDLAVERMTAFTQAMLSRYDFSALLPKVELPYIWLPDLSPFYSIVENALKQWQALSAPGSFFGDVLIVSGRKKGDRKAALDRLANHYFSRGAVIHPNRWLLLERFYRRYADTFGPDPWYHLVVSALDMACNRGIDNQPIGSLYQFLRKEVREEIERTLLDGETLDQYLARQGRRLLWVPDSPEMMAREAEVAAELTQMVETRLEVQAMLSKLSPKDYELAMLVGEGYQLTDVAMLWGMEPGAVRVRWWRLRKEVCAAM